MRRVKCVVVGDHEAEKTRVLLSFTSECPLGDVPRVFDNYPTTMTVRGDEVEMTLWDTAGQQDYDRLRPLSYPQTDVFLVCFSVVSPSSYELVREKFVPEITQHCPDTPFLLVGTRTELRDDHSVQQRLEKSQQRPLQPEDGERLAQELRAVKYMECSAETKKGLKEVFDEAILAALGREDLAAAKSKKSCLLQ